MQATRQQKLLLFILLLAGPQSHPLPLPLPSPSSVWGHIREKNLTYLTQLEEKISMLILSVSASLSFFTQSQLLSPKAHILLLVAIAFSSTILPSPNPHTDLLCALVINYPQVKRLKRAGPKPDRATLMNHTS